MGGIAVNGRFLNKPVTGVERYAREMTSRLGSRVRILCPTGASSGVRSHAWEQFALPRTIGGDVLWSPANTGPLLARRHVITIHDISPIEHPEWFDAGFVAWYRCLIPQLVRRATKVVTVSQFSKSRILERLHVPDDRIVVIPNGVDRRFRPGARTACDRTDASAAPALGLTGPFILTVGSLSPRKNLGRLFSAWQLSGLGRKGCVLAVAGVQCASFKRVDLRTPPVGVRLLGYVPDAELPALYGRALGVVVPSLYEGFGLPALEAMACGTPVIAARVRRQSAARPARTTWCGPFSQVFLASRSRSALGGTRRCAACLVSPPSRSRSCATG